MRKKLGEDYGIRGVYEGTFLRFGIKNGYKHKEGTVILLDLHKIERDGNLTYVCDHLWFNLTLEFLRLWKSEELKVGSKVKLNGTVAGYSKGYEKDEFDYKLSYPRKISIIGFDNKMINQTCDPPFIWEDEKQKLIEKWKKEKEERLIKIKEKNQVPQKQIIDKKKNLLDYF